MKLHAFRDRMNKADDDDGRQLGRHHALDVYRVVAMLTEPELDHARDRCHVRRDAEPVQTAKQIVAEHFSSPVALGVLRLREHPLAGDHLQIERFLELLGELFGPAPR